MQATQGTPDPQKGAPFGAEPADDTAYTDDEARKIYERAAQMQSETLFADEPKTHHDEVERAAGRAGIAEEYVDAAGAELISEQHAAVEAARERAVRGRALRQKAGWAVGALAVLFGLVLWRGQASLSAESAQVMASRAQIENVIQRRHDLVPNLIRVTKACIDDQRDLITALQTAYAHTSTVGDQAQKSAAEASLHDAMNGAMDALKTSAQGRSPLVARLSDELAGSENRIAVERHKYNLVAAEYNRVAGTFPTNVVRPLLGYPAQYEYFKAEPGAAATPQF